ncbi:MAG: hypothetical protein OXR66_09495 [Candidatus Woesearchaeota archaeon]|nr:hypothetical protein [Candidatus Woesearchaeota archaeon]
MVIHSPPPNLEKHRAFCEELGQEPIARAVTEELLYVLKQHALYHEGEWPVATFYSSPDRFFQAWRDGNEKEIGFQGRGSHLSHLTKGFELQYLRWDEEDPFYTIGDRDGLNFQGMLQGMLIATDMNGIMDSIDHVALGVNDFHNKRVLTYRPHDQVTAANEDNWEEDRLLENDDPYLGLFPATFPFESKNPLKSAPETWSAIGFTPDEIYDGLRSVGIKFPED